VCSSPTNRWLPARLAPFIREIASVEGFEDVKAWHCHACDYSFFTPQLAAEHLELLYSGYRNDKYNEIRVRHEPFYIHSLEEVASEETGALYTGRRQLYDQFLSEFRNLGGVVVDFGGGDGYFSRYCFPRATIEIVEVGYEKKRDLLALLNAADFFFCTHVLEHLPDPLSPMMRMLNALRPGTPIYLELPINYPTTISDAFDTVMEHLRVTSGDLPWHAVVTMHEHVAHFSRRSIDTLLRRCGAAPVSSIVHPVNIIGVLGRMGQPRAWLQRP
jgi:hypothetical protein